MANKPKIFLKIKKLNKKRMVKKKEKRERENNNTFWKERGGK